MTRQAGYAAHDEPNQIKGVMYWLTEKGLVWLGITIYSETR